tara:strand:- start:747 stop:1319 length:573 start_codon:yes stop_codon:yes gene_type:complete
MARVKGAKNVFQGWLYDTNIAAAGVVTTEMLYFVVPEGQANKTATDTNMEVGGQLTGVNSFQIRSWVVKMNDLALTADAQMVQGGNFTLRINSVEIPDPLPIEMILGGASLLESVRAPSIPVVPAAGEFRSIGGPGNITNVLSFTRPFLVTLDPGDTFSARLEFPGAVMLPTEAMRLRVVFWGRRTKAVM